MTEEVKDPEAVLAELRRAQEDLKALRAQIKEIEAAKAEAETALEEFKGAGWQDKALTAEVKLALQATGLKDADRLMKYVGTEDLSLDEKGNLVGLDDRLAALKNDLPELFDPKRLVGGQADIHADGKSDSEDPFRQSIRQSLRH